MVIRFLKDLLTIEVNMDYKIGDKVKWLDNSYTIVNVTSRGVILKQNFSIGTILTSPIKIEEIKKK